MFEKKVPPSEVEKLKVMFDNFDWPAFFRDEEKSSFMATILPMVNTVILLIVLFLLMRKK